VGTALVWHTGSRLHVEHLRARALERGLSFSNAELREPAGQIVACPTEHLLYARLDLPFIEPELRGTAADVDGHVARGLPRLVETTDIRGDLHTHSTWSDGRDTLEAMVAQAVDLGYEYMAITDHSERALCSRTLGRADVVRQREALAELSTRHPAIDLLHGIEVEIMPDGTLDFDDDLLASFDLVLASLHDHAGHAPSRLLDRYLAAMAHPLVNVITHPANRAPGHTPGYDLDFNTVMDAARESGTALEIDGAPGHLDMDGALARRAVERGVTLVIDSDAHRTDGLARQMAFGVGTARRGGVEAHHVLNTRPVADIRAFVSAKRAGRRGSNLLP
jgi:DNA polymerase (family 10)